MIFKMHTSPVDEKFPKKIDKEMHFLEYAKFLIKIYFLVNFLGEYFPTGAIFQNQHNISLFKKY
jgi:hypothetical protein